MNYKHAKIQAEMQADIYQQSMLIIQKASGDYEVIFLKNQADWKECDAILTVNPPS